MNKIKLSVILLLAGVALYAQNNQRFLGTYSIERICSAGPLDTTFTYHDIVIEKGIDSDLLLLHFMDNLIVGGDSVKAFTSNDSLFIPEQEWEQEEYYVKHFFWGNGEIRNDSIFLHVVHGTIATIPPYNALVVVGCECKGKKIDPVNVPSIEAGKSNVYYDATDQVIVLDETLQNEKLTFELIDLQGNTILKETNTGESISMVNFPSGIYLYRILQNGRVIYSDKILKR